MTSLEPVSLSQSLLNSTESTPLLAHISIDGRESIDGVEEKEKVESTLPSIFEQKDVAFSLQQHAKEMSHSDVKQLIKTHRVRLLVKMTLFAKTPDTSPSIHSICSASIDSSPSSEQVKKKERTLFALSSSNGISDFYKYCCPIVATEHTRHELFRSAYRGVGKRTFVTIALPVVPRIAEDNRKNIERFISECRYVCTLRSLGVPRIGAMTFARFYDENNKVSPAALLEECSYGALSELSLKEFTEHERMNLMEDIAYAVSELHKNYKCHMDIRKENIFRTYHCGHVQVRFFNFVFDGIVPRQAFLAPEQKETLREGHVVDSPAVDIWQLGDILFFLRFDFSLFERFLRGESVEMTAYQRCYDYACRYCATSKDPFDRFLLTLFSLDPAVRPSAYQVLLAVRELKEKNSLSPTLELNDVEGYSCCCLS